MQNVIIDPKNFSGLVLTFCNSFPPRLIRFLWVYRYILTYRSISSVSEFRVRFIDLVNEQISSISRWCAFVSGDKVEIISKGDDMASSVQWVTLENPPTERKLSRYQFVAANSTLSLEYRFLTYF